MIIWGAWGTMTLKLKDFDAFTVLCWRRFDSMPILHFDEMQGFMIYIALLVNWALFFLKLFKSTTYYMRLMPFIEKTECILHSMRV